MAPVGSETRRIVRFFGPRGDLLAAQSPYVTVYDAKGQVRMRAELDEFLDVVGVGDELWVMTTDHLVRVAASTGREIARERVGYVDPNGRFLVSSTAPQVPVWHGDSPQAVRVGPARLETIGPGGELVFPISDARWLMWQAGQLRSWRTLGEAWRRGIGDPGSPIVDAQLILDARLFAIAQRPRSGEAGGELRVHLAAVSDGASHAQLRIPSVERHAFAARRGLLLTQKGDRLSLFDLRFGRWLRDMAIEPGVIGFAIDEGFQRIALTSADTLELVRPEALPSPTTLEASESTLTDPVQAPPADDEPASTNGHAKTDVAAAPATEPAVDASPEPAPVADEPAVEEPLPDAPLVRLDPVLITVTATPNEILQSIDLRLQLVGARAAVAIAEAWDSGRISKPDPLRPPFAEEVGGLLGVSSGRAAGELSTAVARLRTVEDMINAAERSRAGRLTPLDVLARDFGLNQIAVAALFTVLAPRLRGELARLYGILANDPGRPLVDEYLIGQILGAGFAPHIARELDGDRPLRRYGLIKVGGGDRPFAALGVDPLVTRYVANQPPEGEPDLHLTVRHVDRDLEELQLPRALIAKALRFLGAPRDNEPVRIVVRGRTGSGRHTLLTSLASRAGRSLGVIDLTTVPREPGRMAQALEAVLRRAMLRGLIPCVDGLELISSEDPDTKIQVASTLRHHPGPIALRLPTEAQVPLDPGYLLLDIPSRNERQRTESWGIALERHHIELSDPSELAGRYRVGPGIIERVAAEVSRRPDRPPDAASWVRELDDAVRQHLENRLGTTANRVTRLASWADMVLPEDITDSLLELTARVRHRKKVYEQWGFDKSITTARGITALFSGSPGTGKTMVAGVIARDLGLDLYRVDVSRITSKWIGETEKNLGSLFDAAEDGQVMLLFDEADSLFAKRTEVKTSVDRYANMEVNYLLQRLDSFEGIAILTTNFGNSIDPAFKRRLTYRVTFPFPDEEMREQLWRSLIPPQVPVQGRLDFASLSQRFRLSGGYIRNAALRAAFLAAEEGTALTHEHLERAIRMEFREIGKLAESGTLE